MECCVDCKSKAVKNGRTSYGKQKYLCKSCKRQFVKDGQSWFVSDADRAKIDKLLLERISLRGITRVMDVSLSWLCSYVKTVYATLPDDLNVIEEMPDEEKYLDDKFDKEVNRRLIKKKDDTIEQTDLTYLETEFLGIELIDNEELSVVPDDTIAPPIGLEEDPLIEQVYVKERGLGLMYFGLQLDELWSFVGKKENKQWVWLALNPANRQIVGFHIGERGKADAQLFYDKIPNFFKQKASFFSDYWQAYVSVFADEAHFGVGKDSGLTAYIERFNCTLRQRCSRLVRKTLSFSKSAENHYNALKHFICDYNQKIKSSYL